MDIKLDSDWLKIHYPALVYDEQNHLLAGLFAFRMYYSDEEPDTYVINPDNSIDFTKGHLIEDEYNIEMRFSERYPIPIIKETQGRILHSKEKWKVKNLIDMHVFPDETLCLCPIAEIALRLPDGFNLRDYFENLLIPYFYYQSFFEKYGYEPWKASSHGDLGIFESYFKTVQSGQITPKVLGLYLATLSEVTRNSILQNVIIKGHHICICGSGLMFRKCHLTALQGYKKMLEDHLHYNKMKCIIY